MGELKIRRPSGDVCKIVEGDHQYVGVHVVEEPLYEGDELRSYWLIAGSDLYHFDSDFTEGTTFEHLGRIEMNR